MRNWRSWTWETQLTFYDLICQYNLIEYFPGFWLSAQCVAIHNEYFNLKINVKEEGKDPTSEVEEQEQRYRINGEDRYWSTMSV